jgi:hypothetical protein
MARNYSVMFDRPLILSVDQITGVERFATSTPSLPHNDKAAPVAEDGRLKISGLQRLAFIVDLVGFFPPLSFYPGSCTGGEGFLVTLTINKDDP